MSKKFLGILAFVSFLLSGAYADDILAIVSNGQLTSKSAGVKELSLEERMQVKGGYYTNAYRIAENEYFAVAFPDNTTTYREAVAIYSVTGDSTLTQVLLGYTVKRNIGYSRNGRYVYFTYGVAMVDRNGIHRVNMSSALNSNQVILDLTRQYKTSFESQLGGWYVR